MVFDMPPASAGFPARGGWVLRQLCADLELSPEQAAGIVGNLGFESGGFKELQELAPISGAGGWGWAQWTGPRRVGFNNWCAAHNLDRASDEANYGYLVEELKTSQAYALTRLRECATVEQAVFAFGVEFERPAGTTSTHLPGYDGRLAYARGALAGAAQAEDAPEAIPALDVAATPVSPSPGPPLAPAADLVEQQRNIQRALMAAGLYDGPIDGDPGPMTRDGLRRWRELHPPPS